MKTNSTPFVIGFACCTFLLGGVVKAGEAGATAPAKTEEITKAQNPQELKVTKDSKEAEPKKEEDLSLGRQIAGYAVLTLLLVWMFTRAGKNKVTEETQGENDSQESSRDSKSN